MKELDQLAFMVPKKPDGDIFMVVNYKKRQEGLSQIQCILSALAFPFSFITGTLIFMIFIYTLFIMKCYSLYDPWSV